MARARLARLLGGFAGFLASSACCLSPATEGSTGGGSSGSGGRPLAFAPQAVYPAGAAPFAIAVADLDRSGTLDLAVADNGGGAISLLSGAGDGTFAPRAALGVGGAPLWVTAADLNGDGLPDLAVANSSLNVVQLLFNEGSFRFAAPAAFVTGATPNCVAVVPLDGGLELAVTNYGGSTVTLLAGDGNGSFRQGPARAVGPQPIFVSPYGGGSGLAIAVQDSGDVLVVPSPPGATAAPQPAGPSPTALATGDFNSDGLPDLAVTDWGGGVAVLLAAPLGLQAPVSYAVGSTPNSVAVADFDGDGQLDLAVANADGFAAKPGAVSVLLGRGDGTFEPQISFPVGGSPVQVATGDFNGDGRPDLAVADKADGTVSVLLAR